jgi:hypothetical protein
MVFGKPRRELRQLGRAEPFDGRFDFLNAH